MEFVAGVFLFDGDFNIIFQEIAVDGYFPEAKLVRESCQS